MDVQIKGLDKITARLTPALLGQPLRNFYERATIAVQSQARPRTPSDTAGLRAKLLTEVDSAEVPQFGKVGFLNADEGTPLYFQARAMEFGTGRLGDPAVAHGQGHFPPGPALDVWAQRHGFASGWQVAKIIAKRGGLKPHHMLTDGLKDSLGAINGFVNKIGEDIKAVWDK